MPQLMTTFILFVAATLLTSSRTSLLLVHVRAESEAGVVNECNNLDVVQDSIDSESLQKCIHFTYDNPEWAYTLTGIWGDTSHTFGYSGQTICVPRNDDAGGAMYIGAPPSPGPGNTKLECNFPINPTSVNKPNCDVSLVDGYSLSVICSITATSTTVGGSTDLWATGTSCHQMGNSFCINNRGSSANESTEVDMFFQEATIKGNYYCIWWKCSQDYFFDIFDEITCHVSGSMPD